MPRYDYRCLNCHYQFELIQGFGEGGSGTCPRCSGVSRRLFHAVPVIYKGSGFYTTDYGRPKRPVETGAENGAKESAETKPVPTGRDSPGATPAASDGAASPDKSGSKSEPAGASAKESPASKDTSPG